MSRRETWSGSDSLRTQQTSLGPNVNIGEDEATSGRTSHLIYKAVKKLWLVDMRK